MENNYCIICTTRNTKKTNYCDYEYKTAKSEPIRCRVVEKNVSSEYAKKIAKNFQAELKPIEKKFYKLDYKAVPMRNVTNIYTKLTLTD